MTLHSNTTKVVISQLCIPPHQNLTGNATILFYFDLMSCTTQACFSTFIDILMIPNLESFSNLLCVLLLGNNYYESYILH